MARLNEPAMSTDSLETLRRKFLRQNREIARINSNQSQRIRELENEFARMLTENLELRSYIIRLEKEAESNNTHRIADHALEVKAKLEAQLSIFSSLLEGLGAEPPRKRHSPSPRSEAKPKSSPTLASPARRLRNVARDIEARASQEARLPAIPEYKPYPREPRATLNSDEIRALRGDTEDATDSPDLGPPPVSRFVEDDPVKVNSPSNKTVAVDTKSGNLDPVARIESVTAAPKLDLTRDQSSSRATVGQSECRAPVKADKSAMPATPAPTSQLLRAGAKRKFGEENETIRALKVPERQSSEDTPRDKPRPSLQKRKIFKDVPSNKREPRDKEATLPNPRKALAAKSTNESPRKAAMRPIDDKKPPKQPSGQDDRSKQPPKPGAPIPDPVPTKRPLPVIEIPPPEPTTAPAPVATIPEPETPLPESPLIIPNTPEHSAPRDTARDTPPPGMGDASRPSRRARPAISYAEPNLRDKMRRPTKELFDAVAGEGKFRGRNSIAPPVPPQKTGEEGGSSAVKTASSSSSKGKGQETVPAEEESGGRGMSKAEVAVAAEAARRASVLSPTPLGQRDGVDELPSGIATQRRRRGSSMGVKEGLAPASSMDGLVAATTITAAVSFSKKLGKETVSGADDGDVYDFNSSSPVSDEKAVEGPKSISVRSDRRKARASASFHENGGSSLAEGEASGLRNVGRGGGSRKRASMAAALTKLSTLDHEDADESTGEGEGPPAAKDRISRRRSMML